MKKRKNNCYSMKKMGVAIIAVLLTIILFITSIPLTISAKSKDVTAKSTSSEPLQNQFSVSGKYTVQQVAIELFGDVNIKNCEYLYNLDDSADYIYVEFDNAGYAIFLKETMELLEYSAQGQLNYPETATAKYYGGPSSYMVKENDCFFDTMSQKVLHVTEESAQKYANDVRGMLLSYSNAYLKEKTVEFDYSILESVTEKAADATITFSRQDIGQIPNYDRDDLIRVTNGFYIPNYCYFTLEPLHGQNTGNSCGAVAAQLLLSYHNYYSDRRIIADRFLNGDDSSWAEKQKNLNFCANPMSMTAYTLGTRGYYEDGRDDPNSYFKYVVDKTFGAAEDPRSRNSSEGDNQTSTGLTDSQLKNGIIDILTERNSEISGTINYTVALCSGSGNNPVSSSAVINEIDSGRPVIVLLRERLGGTNHYAVAYGYSYYTYPDTTVPYLGYITHFGWKTRGNEHFSNIWVNASWCSDAITLEIEHDHNYFVVGAIQETTQTESKCITCNHRTDTIIEIADNNRYAEWVAYIPETIYNYKEYYVTFETAGSVLFQTFGSADAQLYLFNTEYTQLAFDDDDGYEVNAMFYYTVQANTPYILRVKFYDANSYGNIKLGITPASYEYDFYEQIDRMPAAGGAWSFDLYYDTTYVLTFTPSTSGMYRIKTTPFDDIDVVVYVADATATTACHCDDNGSTSQVSNFTKNLVAGTSYFIVVSASDISTEEGFVDFSIRKVS